MSEKSKNFISASVPTILVATGLLVVIQQQLLLRRPPKLREINIQQIRSGAAALDVRFSRAMQVDSVKRQSRIHPQFLHQWLGTGKRLRLLLDNKISIKQPIKLELGGFDHRGKKLKRNHLWWDPRPYLLAVTLLPEGEQIQMRRIDGSWLPLSPVFSKISQLEPLGNGSGVAFVSIDKEWRQRVWLRHLKPSAIKTTRDQLTAPRLGPLKLITVEPQVFAFLSSNQHGELLVQVGGEEPGSDRIWVQNGKGEMQNLNLKATSPIRLIPDGSGLVMSSFNGLELMPLLRNERRGSPQILPGVRELKAFCSGSGRAVLAKILSGHRHSVELVIPGSPPKQVWMGEKKIVMAAGCDNGGKRIWVVLRKKSHRPNDLILLLDSDGNILKQRDLSPWLLAPNSRLDYDPVGDQLLLTLRRKNSKIFRLALIQSDALTVTTLEKEIKNSRWLPAGAIIKVP